MEIILSPWLLNTRILNGRSFECVVFPQNVPVRGWPLLGMVIK